MEIQDKKTLIASNLRKFYNFCFYTEPDGKTFNFYPLSVGPLFVDSETRGN